MSTQLLPVGTRVRHAYPRGHGPGTIVAHNGVRPNNYLNTNFGDAVDIAAATGLLGGLVSLSYDGERYPYVVQFDSGYKDVYSPHDLETL